MLKEQENGIRKAVKFFLKDMDKNKVYHYGELEIKWNGTEWMAQRKAEDYFYTVAYKNGNYPLASEQPEAQAYSEANMQLLLWVAKNKLH